MKFRRFAALSVALSLCACNQTHAVYLPESNLHRMVTHKAKQYGVPPALAHGVVKVESRYNCRARNGAHAGIMQVHPRTARGVGVSGNLHDCTTGLDAGMRYLKQALNRAGGNWCWAATLYNRGIYAKPTPSAYCRKVVAYSRGEG